MNTAVCGLQFGDEGKGKIVDLLSVDNDVVVRYAGGANAGHTVVVDNKKYKRHLLPCSFSSDSIGVLAAGMVVDPLILIKEIQESSCNTQIMIDRNCHVVMPWHHKEDIDRCGLLGTTQRGIGPCYAEKANRVNATRIDNLLVRLKDENVKSRFLSTSILKHYLDAALFLQDYIFDTGEFLRDCIKSHKNILFEGAQSIHLDVDHGDCYPFVTSSATGPSAIPQACGLPNIYLDRIVGIIKCYTTRVGTGPFPTEIRDEKLARQIREKGNEYGTTTGRPRRIGWLDIEKTQRAIKLTGATEIALMHTDTMSDIDPYVYKNGRLCRMPKWTNHNDSAVKVFIRMLRSELGIPIKIISFGQDREDVKFVQEIKNGSVVYSNKSEQIIKSL